MWLTGLTMDKCWFRI